MPQIFHRRTNILVRATLACVVLILGGFGWVLHAVYWSPYSTREDVPLAQTVPFSHEHHVGGLGIDCRYCHTSVETSSFAGIPPTETCMTCHSQVWRDAPMLAPVRQSLAEHTPLKWNRVHDLPDFSYFNHSIHINKGIGCSSCHGRVDQMPLMRKEGSLYMKWCLDCHREPEKAIRPQNEIFDMAWQPPKDQIQRGKKLLQQYHVPADRLLECSNCHR